VTKPGSVSIDLDNLAEYQKFYGYAYDGRFVAKLWRASIPRMVDFLDRNRIKATLFVVTEHLAQTEVREALEYLASTGHELASHTHSHPYPFTALADAALRLEMDTSRKILEDTFGLAVVGFRAPAYDIDARGLRALEALGYAYDSSIMPTVLTPLIVLVSRLKSRWRTRSPFHFSHMLAPLRIYTPSMGSPVRAQREPRSILEMPISVLPYLRYPFYPTFLNATGMVGLKAMYLLSRKLSFFNFEMHTIDFVSTGDVSDIACLAGHPGLWYHHKLKIAFYDWLVEELGQTYQWQPLRVVAREWREASARVG
jgi:hypothetical protein